LAEVPLNVTTADPLPATAETDDGALARPWVVKEDAADADAEFPTPLVATTE
jgi:hypothetical protein